MSCDYNCIHDCTSCSKKKCKNPCGCSEPVFSIDAKSDDPTQLRFNVNGKSIWYDFEPVVKAGETCTTLSVDAIARTLNYLGECGENVISANELGSILHLGDLGDVNANSITDNGILNYRKDDDCGEGCESEGSGWQSTNALDVGTTSMQYALGTDKDGKMISLRPPVNTNQQYIMGWDTNNSLSYFQPREVAVPPVDSDGYAYQLWIDPQTKEIVYTKIKQN